MHYTHCWDFEAVLVLCSAFFECADNKGIFEWNTVTNTFVKFFANITGYVSVAPGDDEVLVVGYDSNVNVLKPQGTSFKIAADI